MKRLSGFIMAVLFFSAALALPALGNDSNPHGTYAFTGMRVCVQNNEVGVGFDPPPELRIQGNSGASTRTMAYQGTFEFYGDGTGSMSGVTQQINHNRLYPGGRAVDGADFSCDLGYQTYPDSTFDLTVSNCQGAIFNGYPDTFTTPGPRTTGGVVGAGKHILLMTDTDATEESVILPIYGERKRICSRSFTAVKLSGIED